MASIPFRAINLARHFVAIQSAIPAAHGKIERGLLDCVVPIQPCITSETYSARIRYRHSEPPHVHILEPTLMLRDDADHLPHTYPGNELCLFYPGEWQHDRFLAVTIVPWTAEWLLHYEIWLATGEWTGGGRHPARSRKARRSRTRPVIPPHPLSESSGRDQLKLNRTLVSGAIGQRLSSDGSAALRSGRNSVRQSEPCSDEAEEPAASGSFAISDQRGDVEQIAS